MDITADLPSAISYADPDLVNDDILYGEPGNMGNRIIPKQKPSFPFFPEDYEYPDERQLAPYSPPVDPYEGVYPDQINDRTYGEELIQVHPNPRMMNKQPYMKPRDTYGIEQMGGGMRAFDPLPLISIGFGDEDPIPNIADLDYFNQFTGRNFANPGGMEEEQINPSWSDDKSPGRWNKIYNQFR